MLHGHFCTSSIDIFIFKNIKYINTEACTYLLGIEWASLVVQMVKNSPAMWETWVQSLGWEDPLEEGMATHSSILAWRIPRDRGARLQSMGLQRVRHNWATKHTYTYAYAYTHTHTHTHTNRMAVSHGNSVFNFLRNYLQNCFQDSVPFSILTRSAWEFQFPHILFNTDYFMSF